MQLRTRTWFAISLGCFVAAFFFWRLSVRLEQRRDAERAATSASTASGSNRSGAQSPTASPSSTTNPVSPGGSNPLPGPVTGAVATNSAVRKEPFPHRLSNTPKTVDELGRSDQAILLRNALIDSSGAVDLPIPAHLRSQGDPGAYVVQSRGPLTDAFRAQLAQAGAEIVSYVPNNAYLVRATAESVARLRALAGPQAVLPWEPYYKLEPLLLELAVDQKPMPEAARLNLVAFPDTADAARQALAQAGIGIQAEDRTPFGTMFVVQPAPDALPKLAALASIQAIERNLPRQPVNDLARARVKASANVGPNSGTSANYRGLTGAGVLVNVNDTGVDAGHPGLAGRVTGDSPFTTQDLDGHGTHVAGIVAGSGAGGPNGANVPGSFAESDYRGMAPMANIFAQPIDLNFGPFTSEAALQEAAAATNAIISNNSWGYPGVQDYSFASASWDAAARDALPAVTGPQPLTLVFAAGNFGQGEEDGTGGFPGSISAPGTGKNVITVGATESYRNITNEYIEIVNDGTMDITNVFTPFLGITDSSNQVASFSSRGNVGVGIEGEGGRFKPDVVAPGAMIVSARSRQAALPDTLTNVIPSNVFDQKLAPGQTNIYAIFVPFDGFQMVIQVVSNRFSPTPFPPLLIQIGAGAPPNPGGNVYVNQASLGVTPGIYFYTVANTNRQDVRFDIRAHVVVQVEPPVGYFEVLDEVNDTVGPNYRFETGTSQAAPVVTGLIAMMQEFFLQTFGRTNSPALMKALLINGARTLANEYSFQINPVVNSQGWGLVNVTNSIPEGSAGVVPGDTGTASGTVVFYEQSPERALVSGQSMTRFIDVPPIARDNPMRVTLAWTDPPGNPSVSIKLVNDLDLIVTNLTTGEVFAGNNFQGNSTVTAGVSSNSAPAFDIVNNVENVYLNRGLSARYSVTVRARRVNVNAVPQHPSGIVQDFALVISTERAGGAGLSVSDQPQGFDPSPRLTFVTNGVPVLNQRVGANSPLIVSTNGATNQWHFFVVTNELPPSDPNFAPGRRGDYVAFATFLPPELSIPRTNVQGADIDLYVSSNPNLTNLNAGVISSAFRSVRRGGNESIVLSNAASVDVYYAGVKSEDQQAASFGFFAISSSLPFSNTDSNGNVTALGFPLSANIPDGSPTRPNAALVFAFVTDAIKVSNVTVSNTLSHTSGGDLLGNLSHNANFAVLNNHRSFQGSFLQWIYDDSDSGLIDFSQPVDGPGSLNSFVGDDGTGVWQLAMIDNSPFHTGRVDRLSVTIAPQLDDQLFGPNGLNVRIRAGRFLNQIFTVEVPPDATNLAVCVKPSGGPVEVYIRREAIPTRTEYDMFGVVDQAGGCVTLGRGDSPPLSSGRYYVRLFSPIADIDVNVRIVVERDIGRSESFIFRSSGAELLLDDAVTTSTINVNQSRALADVSVGVRIQHPRVSDLVLHVVSPSGTRLLLAENRGGPNGADYGSGGLQTNTFPVQTSGGAAANTNVLGVTDVQGTLQIDYQFFTVPDRLQVFYENNLIFDSGVVAGGGTFLVDYGPGLSTNLTIIMNPRNNPNATTMWNYTASVFGDYAYATFTENTNVAKLPIKFAPPPFTGLNSAVTNVITGVRVLNDSFEDKPYGRRFAGTRFSGWEVVMTDIEIIPALLFPPYNLAPDTGEFFIDISGFSPSAVFTNVTTRANQKYQVSFAYARNNANPDPVSADVRINGANALSLLAPPGVATNWVHTNFTFTAVSNLTRLELVSTTMNTIDDASAVFFDSFQVAEAEEIISYGLDYLPEEPLKPLFGENAFGEWKLEIWDNRVGAAVTNATLLAWRLNMTFVNTNPAAIPLTNGLAYCATLGTNETAFFQVNVPFNARAVSNLVIAGGPVSLVFQQYGLPTGQEPPDTFFQNGVTDGVTGLSTNGWESYNLTRTLLRGSNSFPILLPGRRYYLAVQNEAPTENSYCVRVDFVLPENFITLSDNVPFCSALGFTLGTNLIGAQTFSFNVNTGAVQAAFHAFNASGNVDLYVQRGTNFTNMAALLTLATNYPYSSTNLGSGREIIRVTTNSMPVPLAPGMWFAAVVNRETTNVSYCVVAHQVYGSNIVTLTNSMSYTATNSGGGVGPIVPVDYYSFNVPANAQRAQWEILKPSGDMTLVLKKDLPLPDLWDAAQISARGGASDELIFLHDYTTNVALTAGNWYMGAVNSTTNTNVYTALAMWYPVNGTNFNFKSSGILTGALCLTWTNTLTNASYYVLGANVPNPPYWVPMPPGVRSLSNEVTWCGPTAPPVFRLAEGLVPTLYPAVSNLDGTPLPTNGFTVRWSAPADLQFRLDFTDPIFPFNWQTLTNNYSSTNGLWEFFDGPYPGSGPPARLYRFFQLP